MSEGQLMETLIAGGSVVVVVGAIAAILFKVTVGDSESRRLDKLKRDLDNKPK